MARRLIGGTLLACGAASGLFFALLSGWFAIELLRKIVDVPTIEAKATFAVLKVLSFGVLAVGTSGLVAWGGRSILGPRDIA